MISSVSSSVFTSILLKYESTKSLNNSSVLTCVLLARQHAPHQSPWQEVPVFHGLLIRWTIYDTSNDFLTPIGCYLKMIKKTLRVVVKSAAILCTCRARKASQRPHSHFQPVCFWSKLASAQTMWGNKTRGWNAVKSWRADLCRRSNKEKHSRSWLLRRLPWCWRTTGRSRGGWPHRCSTTSQGRQKQTNQLRSRL